MKGWIYANRIGHQEGGFQSRKSTTAKESFLQESPKNDRPLASSSTSNSTDWTINNDVPKKRQERPCEPCVFPESLFRFVVDHALPRTTTTTTRTTTRTTTTKMDVPSSFFSFQTVIWSGCVTAALLSALFVVQRERQKRYDENGRSSYRNTVAVIHVPVLIDTCLFVSIV